LKGTPPTASSDLYSMGVLLCELLTGKRPTRERRRELFLDGPPLEEGIENIIRKAVEEEPSQRYATVELLANDLRRYLEGQPVPVPAFRPGLSPSNGDTTSSAAAKS